MSSSKCLSISELFFISPSSTIWLLLFLPMLPDQTHQISLVFGLTTALFYSDICPCHVCIEVLSLSSAFEPQQWLWSPGLLLRSDWHGDLSVGIAIGAGHQHPSGGPFLCQGHPCGYHLSYHRYFHSLSTVSHMDRT